MTIRIIQGDCIEVMHTLADCSVDAVVTDPPYGIRFMGKAWDGADIEKRYVTDGSTDERRQRTGMAAAAGKYDLAPPAMLAFQEFSAAWAREALRILKPGGYLLSFSSPRTYHRMTSGIEDAGFEVRDQILWVFGSGFPKSHNGEWGGTGLKPAHEPMVMARKPLQGTVAENWRKWGTGALNIDACRIHTDEDLNGGAYSPNGRQSVSGSLRAGGGMNVIGATAGEFVQPIGRWPANLIHDGSDEVLAAFPDAPGQSSAVTGNEPTANGFSGAVYGQPGKTQRATMQPRGDIGSAARFFYCAKASAADRHEGLAHPGHQFAQNRTPADAEKVQAAGKGNHHPTVKPTDLMRYLVRLITPPGGTVLDQFAGSGSTLKAAELEGFGAIGIELDAAYVEIARRRIAADAPLFANVETS